MQSRVILKTTAIHTLLPLPCRCSVDHLTDASKRLDEHWCGMWLHTPPESSTYATASAATLLMRILSVSAADTACMVVLLLLLLLPWWTSKRPSRTFYIRLRRLYHLISVTASAVWCRAIAINFLRVANFIMLVGVLMVTVEWLCERLCNVMVVRWQWSRIQRIAVDSRIVVYCWLNQICSYFRICCMKYWSCFAFNEN